MSVPDYAAIARSICDNFALNGTSTSAAMRSALAGTLQAMYERGRDDGIDQEEMDLLVRHRISGHVAKIDNLSDRIRDLSREISNELPRVKR